jgi:hypothetical protein
VAHATRTATAAGIFLDQQAREGPVEIAAIAESR